MSYCQILDFVPIFSPFFFFHNLLFPDTLYSVFSSFQTWAGLRHPPTQSSLIGNGCSNPLCRRVGLSKRRWSYWASCSAVSLTFWIPVHDGRSSLRPRSACRTSPCSLQTAAKTKTTDSYNNHCPFGLYDTRGFMVCSLSETDSCYCGRICNMHFLTEFLCVCMINQC